FRFDASEIAGADGAAVDAWSDAVGGHDAAADGGAPSLATVDGMAGRNTVDFSGTSDAMRMTSVGEVNGQSFTEKSFAIAFEAGEDVSGTQVIYEQGGAIRGYSLAIAPDPDNGDAPTLFAFVWNNAEWDGEHEYKAINMGEVTPGENYNIVMVHDATDANPEAQTWSAYVDGELAGVLDHVGPQFSHTGRPGVGGVADNSIHPVTHKSIGESGTDFHGEIGEVLSWNAALDAGEAGDVNAYLETKWSDGGQLEGVVAEDASAGVVVGNVSVVDPDVGDSHTYAVDDARFEVVDGEVRIANGADFDHESEPEIDITVTATDAAGQSVSETFIVNVTDVNEAPTDISVAPPALPGGELAFQYTGDADFSETTETLNLSSSVDINKSTFTEKSFAIAFETGEDMSGTQVIYEQGGSTRGYSLSIAPDPDNGDAPTLYAFVWNKAEWDDDHEYKAINMGEVEPGESYSVVMVHNATGATPAEQTWSAYLDGEHAGTLDHVGMQYSHGDAPGIGGVTNGSVHPVTHKGIKEGDATDFNGTVHEIASWNDALEASDIAAASDYLDAKWAGEQNVSVMEDAAAGTVVARLQTEDPDAGETFTYEIVGDAPFEISGDALVVKDGAEFDFETAETADVTVRVTDSGGLSYEETLTVNIQNVNEAPDLIAPTISTVSGLEASYYDIGEAIGNLSDIDFSATPDATAVVGSIDHMDRSDPFWDGGADNQFAAKYEGQLNVETGGTYTFDLTSDDGSALYIDGVLVNDNDGLHSTRTETVTIDLDAGAHDIEILYFENGGSQTLQLAWSGPDTGDVMEVVSGDAFSHDTGGLSVTENDSGAVVTALSVTDPDTGDVHTYSVDDARFEVVDVDGVMTLKLKDGVSLNHEDADTVSVTVTAQDAAGLEDSETLSIDVGNVNEAPVATDASDQAATEETPFSYDAAQHFSDPDAGDLTYAVTGPNWLSIDADTGMLTGTPDDADIGDATVTVTATDAGGLQATTTFDLSVESVNDAPVLYTGDAASGLQASYYDIGEAIGNLSDIDFSATPDATAVVGSIDHMDRSDPFWDGGADNQFAAKYEGQLNVETGGTYTFDLTSDDGSALYIDGVLVNDNDGLHSTRTETVTIDLDAGAHDIEILYFENGGSQTLQLAWSGPDTGDAMEVVSGDAFSHNGDLGPVSVDENAEGAVVTTISVSDPDVGDAHTYSVDDARFEVVDVDGAMTLKLKDGVALDYDVETEVSVDVTVTDAAGASDTETVSFAVADQNAAPTGFEIAGASAGTFQESGGLLVVEAENHVSNTAGDDGHAWSASETDGAMHVDDGSTYNDMWKTESDVEANAPELAYNVHFETPGTYYVHVRGMAEDGPTGNADSVHIGLNGERLTDDGGLTGFGGSMSWGDRDTYTGQRVAITVDEPGAYELNVWAREDGVAIDKIVLTQDADYNPSGAGPDESPRGDFASVSEDAEAGDVVASLSAIDTDASDSHVYEIVDSDGNPVADANFEMVGNEVRVKDGATLDYETASSHEVHIRVTDEGGESIVQTLTVGVSDVEENVAPTVLR
ncbi:MAG: PA14 domain-containing protein, partial [Pseudomonadota bacterium]